MGAHWGAGVGVLAVGQGLAIRAPTECAGPGECERMTVMSVRGVFLARSDERRRFLDAEVRTREGVGIKDSPTVVLVPGIGGIGKSSLLRQFQEACGERDAVAWIDFEEARKSQPAAFGGDYGPALQTVLDLIMRECLEALELHNDRTPAEKAFGEYRSDVVKLPRLFDQMRAAAADATQSGATKEEIAALEKSAVALGTLLTHQPIGVPMAVGAASAVGQAAASRPGLWKRLRGAPDVAADDYDLATDPHRALARVFGASIAQLSGLRPLVIFLDTSEIVMPQMQWLREAMRNSSDRVLWVVAVRLEPEASADPNSEVAAFVRQMPDDRLRLMALTRFDDETVGEYLENRLPGRHFGADDIIRVAEFTKGLPLAVSLVADLLERGASLDQALATVERPRDVLAPVTAGEVVGALARRFLIHTEGVASDRARRDLHRILCLAIANGYPTRSPDVLRALWDTEDDLFDSLRELADRHDFVMSGTFRLHDDVRDALRADLCEPVRRTRIQASCRRAATVIENELARQRDLLHTLDDQVNSATYLALLYDLVWYRFWMQPEAGWKSAMTLLPILAVANEQATESLLGQMEWFAEHGTADEAARFDELAEPSRSSFLDERLARRRGQPVSGAKLAVKVTPTALAMLSRLTPDEGLLGAPLDRDAGLEVLRTRLLLTNELGESELTDATVKLQRLANSAPGLATPIAKTLMAAARAGVDSNASPGMLKAAGRAAIASNGLARQQGWELGHIASALHHPPDLKDLTDQLYTLALEADPQHAPTLGNYAVFLTAVRGDHDAAEAMYKRALEADPQHANTLGNYARLLFIIGQDEEGERLARQAIPLASPREDALRAECNFYLFMHVPVARAEAAAALRELLCRNVSTGDWDFGQNLNRVHRSADSQYPLLLAVADALRVGDATSLVDYPEWSCA